VFRWKRIESPPFLSRQSNGAGRIVVRAVIIRLRTGLAGRRCNFGREKQISQVVENLESGGKPKEALEGVTMRPRQVRYQAALRPDIYCSLILAYAHVLQ
jgi:hypothetical protein